MLITKTTEMIRHTNHTDWRKKYKRRTKTLEEIKAYAIKYFIEEFNYDIRYCNCQDFAWKIINFACS